jgi:DegV family protein with EDD domain
MKVKIIADAVSNLFPSVVKEKNLDIRVIPLQLRQEDKEFVCYDENIDIVEFSKTYYSNMENGEVTKTSLISPGQYLEVFKEEISKGNKVICFTMAKGISGTYNSACLARDEINESYKEKMVEVIDCMTAGFGEGLQAIHAYELVKDGKSYEEIIQECEEFKHYVRSDFTVDNVKYLINTGRVSKTLARFLRLLNIKILLKRSDKSDIAFAGSAVGKNNAIKQLCRTVVDNIDLDKKQIVYVTHCNIPEEANKIKEILEKGGIKDIEIYDYDVISGAHIGPRSLAVFYIAKEPY